VKSIYAKNDYHEHGGAPLLGVNGGMIIAHGSSEPRTIKAAIRKMREFVASGVNAAIVERLHQLGTMPEFAHLREAEPEAA